MPQFNQSVGSEGLNTYYSGAWRNTGTADYGSYGGSPARLGIMHFSDLNLKGKKILSVKFAAKTSAAGGNVMKYVLMYDSKYNYINTSATGLAHLGTELGMFSQKFYNNTIYAMEADFLADKIAEGVNTFVIYHEFESSSGSTSYSSNYLKWTSVSIQVDWEEATSPCTAPSSFTLSPQETETTATLSWSGASGGVNNAIKSYRVQYRDSLDKQAWSAWADVGSPTAANVSVSAPAAGYFRQFRVSTLGEAGADFNSHWATCPTMLTRIVAPTAPTSFTATPAVYASGNVTLQWSGAVTGSSAIAKYEIQYSVSSDNAAWGAWQAVSTVNSAATSGSTTTTKVNPAGGGYTRYQIRAVDANGKPSAYKVSGSIRTNTVPTAPTVNWPPQNGITYNPTPCLLVTLGADTDAQTLAAAGYTASRSSALTSGSKVVLKRNSALSASGSQTASVTATDTYGAASPAATRALTYQKPVYADATLVSGSTFIRAEHMTELRACVNTIRAYYGIGAKVWSEAITPGVTKLAGWKAHVLELRSAMEDVAAVINGWDTASTTNNVKLPTWIDIPVNKPTVAVMLQLREALSLL